MALETATYVSDLVTTNPIGATDKRSQGDDHLRLLKSVLKTTFPIASAPFYFPHTLAKSATYTIVAADDNAWVYVDATAGAVTLNLTAAATLSGRFRFNVMKIDSSANTVTIDPAGAETVNGAATLVLGTQYEVAELFCTGTAWYAPAYAQVGDTNTFSVVGVPVRFVNTADSASVQVAKFEGDRATMADADEAYVSLLLSNDAGTQTEFARIGWVADDVNAGTNVDGSFFFSVATAGVLAKELVLNGAALSPAVSDGNALGTSSLMWGDLFLASGGVINFNAGDVLITHSANTLAFTGAASGYTFDVAPSVGGSSVVLSSRSLTAAGIVTGGGDLSANRTFTVTAAQQADQETGSSTTVAVVPGVQHFHPSAAKCWAYVTVSGGTPTLVTSYNITSITDVGVGDLTITIGTDFSTANWSSVSIGGAATITATRTILVVAKAAGSVELGCFTSGPSAADPSEWNFVGQGDL